MAKQKIIIEEDEIDLVELVKTIWSGRTQIAKITSVFLVFGLIVAFTSKVEYEASCRLLPESQEGVIPNLGGLGSLAGLAGFDLGSISNSSDNLSPELYPEMVKNLPNQLVIINDTLDFESKELKTSSLDYFQNYDKPSLFEHIAKYTIGLPWEIKSWFEVEESNFSNNSKIYRFTEEEWELLEDFEERISIVVDDEFGFIDISVEMPDAMAAAQLTITVMNVMTEKVTEYKIEKVKNSLDFVMAAYNDAEVIFKDAQEKLAIATDRNKHINSAAANIELQTLKNEYDLAFEVFKGLASQLEQAKIKLKEETPVFTVLEPVRVPEDKSSPKRGLILLGFGLMGLVIGVLITFIVFWWERIKES